MGDHAPTWPTEAVFPARGLTKAEQAIVPRAWFCEVEDGYPLAVLSWSQAEATNARAETDVVVLHGVQSHAGWYHGLGRRLAAAGYRAHFPDRRGSGANRQARGHAPSARRLIDDVADVVQSVRRGRVILAGISWGGKLAVATAAEHAGLVDGVVLICPGLHPRVGVSFREKLGVAVALCTGRAASSAFTIPLSDPALFSAQEDARRFIAHDPLSLRAATAGLMFASRVLDRHVRRAAGLVRQPVLLLLAGHDRVIDNEQTRAYVARMASPHQQVIEFPDAHHTLEFEPDPSSYARELIAWIGRAASHAERA